MVLDFECLKWDSDFFEFPVWRISGDWSIKDLEYPYEKEVKLLYYSSKEPIEKIKLNNNYYNAILVDQKVPLKKVLDRETEIHPNISFYTDKEVNEELILMAQHAGGSTRFKVDPNISEFKYKQLFEIWIKRSVSGELADHVLVYKVIDKIVGFASISLKDSLPYVSLLAVRPDYEGKGVAFALMRAIERILRDLGYQEVFGSTQLSNRKALIVYERYGLKRQPINYIYHLWRKEKL